MSVCPKMYLRVDGFENEKSKELILKISDDVSSFNIALNVNTPLFDSEVLCIAKGIQDAILEMKKNRIEAYMKVPTACNRCV